MSHRRGQKRRFQVEALEGRIALSSAAPIPGPAGAGPAPALVAAAGGDASEQTLHRGGHGTAVRALQSALIRLPSGVGPDGPDGDFGKDTEAAVRAFQKRHHPPLDVDGIVGPMTWAALHQDLKPIAAAVTPGQLHSIMPRLPRADLNRYIGILNSMLKEFHINTPKREAAFLA